MDTAEIVRIQIITTIVVTAANVLLVLLTSAYVYLTRQMVNETRAIRDPSVFVDLELPEESARLSIGNSGQSAALNIKFMVEEDAPWVGRGRFSEGIKSLEVIKNGVSYLPAGRTLKYSVGALEWEQIDEKRRWLKIQVTYENDIGRKFKREHHIDLAQYKGLLFESYRDSNMAIAKAISEAERSRRFSEDSDRRLKDMGFHAIHEKRCPMCAELIPNAAKKCSHCGEMLESS